MKNIIKQFNIFLSLIALVTIASCSSSSVDNTTPATLTKLTISTKANSLVTNTSVAGEGGDEGVSKSLTSIYTVKATPSTASDAVTWTVDPAYPGVTITGTSLKVAKTAAAGTVTLKATSTTVKTISATTTYTITPATTTATAPTALAIALKTGKTASSVAGTATTVSLTEYYTVTPTPATASNAVTWTVDPAHAGATISGTTLTITATAAAGTVTLKATSTVATTVSRTTTYTLTSATTPTYKIQAKVGSVATVTTTATALGDTATVELDPNELTKLGAQFVVLEGTTPKTTGVVFTTNTALPDTAHGVTVTNLAGNYLVFITPATYTATADVTYTLTATIGTGDSATTVTRQFTIKGKTAATATTKTLVLTGTLPSAGTGKQNVIWLVNGTEKYNAGVYGSTSPVRKTAIPASKLVAGTTELVVTVETAATVADAEALTAPGSSALKLIAISVASLTASNPVTKYYDKAVPSVAQTFILATPSDTVTTNERSGVWFKKAAGATAGLTLVDLTGTTYSYEGWVVIGTGDTAKKISTGTFKNPAVADLGKYYYSGTTAPPFPGEDFLTNPAAPDARNIAGVTMPLTVAYDVVITLEPTTETGDAETAPTAHVLYKKPVAADAATHADVTLVKAGLLTATLTVE